MAGEKQETGSIPEFTIHDRCRKAREFAELEQAQLAERIYVDRQTVGNYERGTVKALKPLVLRQWALACGVSFEWLATGTAGPTGGEYAPGDSNPEPSDSVRQRDAA